MSSSQNYFQGPETLSQSERSSAAFGKHTLQEPGSIQSSIVHQTLETKKQRMPSVNDMFQQTFERGRGQIAFNSQVEDESNDFQLTRTNSKDDEEEKQVQKEIRSSRSNNEASNLEYTSSQENTSKNLNQASRTDDTPTELLSAPHAGSLPQTQSLTMAVTNSQEESNTHSQEHRASKNISHSLISNDLRLSVLHASQTSDQITPVGTTVLSGN